MLAERSTSAMVPVRELASGVDALYLSGRVVLPGSLIELLEAGRAEAAEAEAPVPVVLAGEEFGLEAGAFGLHRFRLVHPAGMIGVTASENLPALRVQPRAEFLHAVGPRVALAFFDRIGEYLAGRPVSWSLSRLDLFCDVQGWELVGDDRHQFVCRGRALMTHEDNEAFTGFEFGRRKTKTVCARIYDKTVQVEQKGLDWWPAIWGDAFDASLPVLRVEFEIGREGLVEYQALTPLAGLAAVGRLWASVTADWLSYRIPGDDATKSRWPVAPEWAVVQGASLRSGALGVDRLRAGRQQGELRTILPQLVGYLATVGAIMGTRDLPSTLGAVRVLVAGDERRRKLLFESRVAERVTARRYQ